MCGTKVRRIGNWSKRSEWFSEEIGELIKRKKVAFEVYLINRMKVVGRIIKKNVRK